MKDFIDKITLGDCRDFLPEISQESVHLFLSDIPYGIGLDEWDVLHNNTNSAYLGQSPAQKGKSGFKRRGKPIRGWNTADRDIVREYEKWCF
jgi:site-specific DNA-methyltransferase (adenine-specific)